MLENATDADVTAWIVPLSGDRDRLAYRSDLGIAAILIGAPEGQLPGNLLMRRFGLTPAQVRVLGLLTQGHSASDVAEILGVSVNTIRSHMQQLFVKTASGSLPELLHFCQKHLAPVQI